MLDLDVDGQSSVSRLAGPIWAQINNTGNVELPNESIVKLQYEFLKEKGRLVGNKEWVSQASDGSWQGASDANWALCIEMETKR